MQSEKLNEKLIEMFENLENVKELVSKIYKITKKRFDVRLFPEFEEDFKVEVPLEGNVLTVHISEDGVIKFENRKFNLVRVYSEFGYLRLRFIFQEKNNSNNSYNSHVVLAVEPVFKYYNHFLEFIYNLPVILEAIKASIKELERRYSKLQSEVAKAEEFINLLEILKK